MPIKFKNIWGSTDGGVDQQRADLFQVQIDLPSVIGKITRWAESVEFALTRFPFPERKIEMIAIKRMQQTNHVIGPDQATGPIEIPVRYAFNRDTAQVLEKWFQLTSNPQTGASSLTSKVKASGEFWHLVPNQSEVNDIGQVPTDTALQRGLTWKLEGILISGFTPAQADNTATGDAALQMYNFNLHIDRYYPKNIDAMVVQTQ